jgi:hypothetical protein
MLMAQSASAAVQPVAYTHLPVVAHMSSSASAWRELALHGRSWRSPSRKMKSSLSKRRIVSTRTIPSADSYKKSPSSRYERTS